MQQAPRGRRLDGSRRLSDAGSKPDRRALRFIFVDKHERGEVGWDALGDAVAPLLRFLDVFPVLFDLSRGSAATSPNTCGWR